VADEEEDGGAHAAMAEEALTPDAGRQTSDVEVRGNGSESGCARERRTRLRGGEECCIKESADAVDKERHAFAPLDSFPLVRLLPTCRVGTHGEKYIGVRLFVWCSSVSSVRERR
jgi:hypothetical protein